MLFPALKGLFFLERRLKATMVWFIGLSCTGCSGTFRGGTQNRTESLGQQARMDPSYTGVSLSHVNVKSSDVSRTAGLRDPLGRAKEHHYVQEGASLPGTTRSPMCPGALQVPGPGCCFSPVLVILRTGSLRLNCQAEIAAGPLA